MAGRVSLALPTVGRLGHLDAEQEAKLAEMKTKLKPEQIWSDPDLLRFLRARKWDVDAAIEQFVKMLDWRKLMFVDHVEDFMPIKTRLADFAVPHSYHGFDRLHRPLYVEKTGRMLPDVMLSTFADEELVWAHIWTMEHSTKRFPEAIARAGGYHIETFSNIMDLEGMDLSFRKALHFIKLFAAVDGPNYPERMGTLFIINAPSLLSALWSIIQNWLDPVTLSKIHILGYDYQKELHEVIDPAELPVEYGGTCRKCLNTVPGATASMCVPYHSEDVLNQKIRAFVDESQMQLKKVHLDSGSKHELTFDLDANENINWYFKTECYDIDFEVEIHVQGRQDPHKLIALKRISHDSVGFQGSYLAVEKTSLKITWSNEFTMFYSKDLLYFITREPNFLPRPKDEEKE